MEGTLCGTERKLLQGACSLPFLYIKFQVSNLIYNRHRGERKSSQIWVNGQYLGEKCLGEDGMR